MELTFLTTLLAVAVGWLLSELSARLKWRREARARLSNLLIENYAEWCAGIEERLQAYAVQDSGSLSDLQLPVIEKRLMLLEPDSEARRLVREVNKSIPMLGSEDFTDLQRSARSPDWEWPPFREKMNRLLEFLQDRFVKQANP